MYSNNNSLLRDGNGSYNRGQVVLEYFILFAVVATLTMVGVSAFHQDVSKSLQDFFDGATHDMAH